MIVWFARGRRRGPAGASGCLQRPGNMLMRSLRQEPHAFALNRLHSDDLLALDEALERLAAEEPEVAQVVRLRSFAGLTAEQAAALGLSLRTANRHWAYARAWLFAALEGAEEAEP